MTIEVMITHNNPGYDKSLRVARIDVPSGEEVSQVEIDPGEKHRDLVHSAQELIIREA